jgi:hypothetical protein
VGTLTVALMFSPVKVTVCSMGELYTGKQVHK